MKFSNIFICLFLASNLKSQKLYGIEKLIFDIFNIKKYNILVRPFENGTGYTNVFTELKLLQIDLDEKYQELISTAWVEMSWEDSRFIWNPSDYDGVSEITLPVEKIWYPDIVLENGVGKNNYLTEFKYFNPWISHTGSVTWVPEVRLNTKCLINVKDFPFDKQCCEVSFYSWAHTAKQMVIKQFLNKNTTNTTHVSTNTEWRIYHTYASNHTIRTGEDLDWWVTTYSVYIKRNSLYHVYTLLMPCCVLSCFSCLLFLLPPDSGEKISLGVTILLTLFVNLLVVANYTPEASSELPVIGIYYTFNIAQVSLSLACTIIVLRFHFRGHKQYKLPKIFKKIMFFAKNQLNNQKYIVYHSNLNCRSSLKNGFNIKSKNLENIKHDKNYIRQISETLRSIKRIQKEFKKQKKLESINESNLVEWKEAAKRLDNIFFIFSFIAVTLTPLYLFHSYLIEESAENFSKLSRCL